MIEAIKTILSSQPISIKSPYGDGFAAEKIVDILKKEPIIPLARKAISEIYSNIASYFFFHNLKNSPKRIFLLQS